MLSLLNVKQRLLFFSTMLLLLGLTSCIHNLKSPEQNLHEGKQIYRSIAYQYRGERSIIHTPETEAPIKRLLKNEIMIKNEEHNQQGTSWWSIIFDIDDNPYRNYPFIQYKVVLDNSIAELKKQFNILYWNNREFGTAVQRLIDDLQTIKRFVITYDEYRKERIAFDKKQSHKQEQHKIVHLLDKQNNSIREQNRIMKEQQQPNITETIEINQFIYTD